MIIPLHSFNDFFDLSHILFHFSLSSALSGISVAFMMPDIWCVIFLAQFYLFIYFCFLIWAWDIVYWPIFCLIIIPDFTLFCSADGSLIWLLFFLCYVFHFLSYLNFIHLTKFSFVLHLITQINYSYCNTLELATGFLSAVFLVTLYLCVCFF